MAPVAVIPDIDSKNASTGGESHPRVRNGTEGSHQQPGRGHHGEPFHATQDVLALVDRAAQELARDGGQRAGDDKTDRVSLLVGEQRDGQRCQKRGAKDPKHASREVKNDDQSHRGLMLRR